MGHHPTQQVLSHGQGQSVDSVQTPQDSELAKWKAVELFKVQIARLRVCPNHSVCLADHSELCTNHSHSCRRRCEMDIRIGYTLPDGR